MSSIPLPKHLKNNDEHQRCYPYNQNKLNIELPYPILHPSDAWLAAHKQIIYDTTENWEKSELRLRLGTIAINYNLSNELSDSSFGIKVAFKDKYGNPQIWSNLPFIRQDLTPFIEEIALKLSVYLSSDFVLRSEFYNFASDISATINEISTISPIDTARLVLSNLPLFLNCGTSAK